MNFSSKNSEMKETDEEESPHDNMPKNIKKGYSFGLLKLPNIFSIKNMYTVCILYIHIFDTVCNFIYYISVLCILFVKY
jgi:hypothetical protein